MYINLVYSVHHNEERSYSPEVFIVDALPPTDEQLCKIIRSILENSVGHSDWVYDEDEYEEYNLNEWIVLNKDVLIKWLFFTGDVECTLACPFGDDGNDLWLFNEPDRSDRNIGLNVPNGYKGDGLWVSAKVIDDLVAPKVEAFCSTMTHEQMATKLAIRDFGMLRE